jgi:hypothetical protein
MSKIIVLLVTVVFIFLSCKKKDPEATGIDKEMLEMAKKENLFIWYKNNPAFLDKSSGSGHSFSKLRTRYNNRAASMLDSVWKVKEGVIFPEESFIVKELSGNGQTVSRYAMLLKRTGHSAADSKGWIWGYINSDGTVADPASNKGGGCIGCHNQPASIDYMLMNKYFP